MVGPVETWEAWLSHGWAQCAWQQQFDGLDGRIGRSVGQTRECGLSARPTKRCYVVMHSIADLWCIQCHVNCESLVASNQNNPLLHLFVGRGNQPSELRPWIQIDRPTHHNVDIIHVAFAVLVFPFVFKRRDSRRSGSEAESGSLPVCSRITAGRLGSQNLRLAKMHSQWMRFAPL